MRTLMLSIALVGAVDVGPLPPPEPPPPTAAVVAQDVTPDVAARAPQFVVISFDGAADTELMARWRAVARESRAHFTFFVSGVYLVPWADRMTYRPPQRAAGSSDIGFAPDRAWADGIAGSLREATADGHEIATHYGGHFCGPRGVASWGPRDWSAELEAVATIARASGLPAPIGGRTPCLEGNLPFVRGALAARGLRYDASATAREGEPPRKVDGVWSFPLPLIDRVGAGQPVLAMDYNFYLNQSDARDVADPLEAGAFERQMLDSYLASFRRAYDGDRTPLSIGHHFTDWNGGAYERALASFVRTVCVKPEVGCASYRELADWLDAAR